MDRTHVVAAVAALAAAFSPYAFSAEPMLVMPAEFTYYQMSAGGVIDTLPEQTEAARRNFAAAAGTRLASGKLYDAVQLPELTADEQALLDEHLVLFDVIANDIVTLGWPHKRNAFDYTLGPGLSFLADRSGAEKAMFISGASVSASGGRVAMAIFAAAAVGAAINTGGGMLLTGIVDLRTGAIEWLESNQALSGQSNPASEQGANNALGYMLQRYPKSRFFRARAQ